MSTVTDLRGRHFLTLADYSPEEMTYLLELAAELKEEKLGRGVGTPPPGDRRARPARGRPGVRARAL